MAVPTTNVGMSDIQTEFGGSNPISLSEYYAGGPLVPAGTSSPVAGSIPSSGEIAVGDFRGAVAATFIVASGGTVTTDGDFKIHRFTGPGTFTVSSVGNPAGSDAVDYTVVAGGGSGGRGHGGGGGSGGYRATGYGPSPLRGSAFSVSAQGYPITIGGGGAAPPSVVPLQNGSNGVDSTFSSITSNGGGLGAGFNNTGGSGGSGGGSGSNASSGGSGNQGSFSPPEGNNGGAGSPGPNQAGGGGGGGGAGGAGSVATGTIYPFQGADGGAAGAGVPNTIFPPVPGYGGGGGGGSYFSPGITPGGSFGGGPGANSPASPGSGTAGTANLGGGGGGSGTGPAGGGGAGGSGVVVIRYKFQ